MLKLAPVHVGRPVTDIELDLNGADLESLIVEVVDTATDREVAATDREGNSCLLQVRPHRTPENRVDGALLVLMNIDALKRSAAGIGSP
jgi:two-component system CheB/CheR fusion protein